MHNSHLPPKIEMAAMTERQEQELLSALKKYKLEHGDYLTILPLIALLLLDLLNPNLGPQLCESNAPKSMCLLRSWWTGFFAKAMAD